MAHYMKHNLKGTNSVFSCLVCGFILSMFIGAKACAVNVYFGDMDRAPTSQLQIGGITISSTGHGLPSTVAGLGLGAAGIGSSGTLDMTNYNWNGESLVLSVNGTINSFTIVPYFTDFTNPDQEFTPFEMGYYMIGLDRGYQILTNSDPVTITPYPGNSQVEVDLYADFGQYMFFADYLQQHPNAQLDFGYTIQSLDYTPSSIPVPEPSSFKFALLGMIAAWLCCSRKKKSEIPAFKSGELSGSHRQAIPQ